jgi:hypothetical protein
MPVENIDALSDEVIERRALKVLQRAELTRRRRETDNDPLTKADYRAAYNLLVGWCATDSRGLIRRHFLLEGTEAEMCARLAMGRALRRLSRSGLDSEMATLLVLLAGHFDGKIGYATVPDFGLYKSKWPTSELAARRRLRFDNHMRDSIGPEVGIAHRLWDRFKSFQLIEEKKRAFIRVWSIVRHLARRIAQMP